MRSCTRFAQSSARMAGGASGFRCVRLPSDSRSHSSPAWFNLAWQSSRLLGTDRPGLYLVEAKIQHECRGFEVPAPSLLLLHAATRVEYRPSSVAWGLRTGKRNPTGDSEFVLVSHHEAPDHSAGICCEVVLCCPNLDDCCEVAGFCEVLGHAASACCQGGRSGR